MFARITRLVNGWLTAFEFSFSEFVVRINKNLNDRLQSLKFTRKATASTR